MEHSDRRYPPVLAVWNKTLHLLAQPPGKHALRMIFSYFNKDDTHPRTLTDPMFDQTAELFLGNICTISPMLIIDDTMATPLVAMHPHGKWDGDYSSFETHKQALYLNGNVGRRHVYPHPLY